MENKIEAKCGYLSEENAWAIQIIVPQDGDSKKACDMALSLADEFLKIAKERMEIESGRKA